MKRIIDKCKQIIGKQLFENKKEDIQLPYIPLSPTDSAEDCDVYLDALSWALSNKKQIKNIAISGSYGSGKSSILQTFIKREEHKKWSFHKNHFLNISLATFEVPKKSNGQENSNHHTCDNDTQRLIELSLLQQLFYRETNSKIPDSRLKKIQSLKSWKLFLQTIVSMIFIFSLIVLILPNEMDYFFNLEESIFASNIAKYIALTVSLVILFVFFYKSSRSIIGLSIKKLNLKGTEIEIDKNISKSILNNYIDEIIYFFEATNYNVIIIEDLDRFGNSEVFTKLREINLLINNSKKVKQDIVFIYAIKDDMFLDKDRAKFFDYMLPVIPIVNFSNSGDKLKKMLEGESIKIDNDLIDDLSLFVDDMRLLYNIMNEFHIYATKVNQQLDMNKLLAIIVYKNLFPKDFTDLSENKGELFETINSKNKYIENAINQINKQIESIKERLRLSDESFVSDIKDLRTLYVSKICEKILEKAPPLVGLKDNDEKVSIEHFTDDNTFCKIKGGNLDYYYFDHHYNGRYSNSYSFEFNEIEKQVNSNYTYDQREKIIADKQANKNNNLRIAITNLQKQIGRIRKSSLREILSEGKIKINCTDDKKKELIDILLRNGYINENYLDYISVFHEGALSKTDYQFLINVKRELSPQFDYTLNKKEELLKRINLYTFEKECILNFDLVDALIISQYTDKTDTLFRQLANEHEITIKFINEYIDKSKHKSMFVNQLCSYWNNIWRYIRQEPSYTDGRKEQYFLLILKYATINDLYNIFDENDTYIKNYRDFFIIHVDNKKKQKLVEKLGIVFKTISPDSPAQDLTFLMQNSYYEINIEMLKIIIPKDKFEQENFNSKNYSYLKNSGLNDIVEYIEEEINTYVEKILLELRGNTREELEEYTILLNNSKLNIKLKDKLIQQIETIVDDISTITGLDEAHLLFQYSKVRPTWGNVQTMFANDEDSLSPSVITFLNQGNNAIALARNKMTTDKDEDGVEIYSKLCKALMHENSINDRSYKLLVSSIPWCYNSFDSNSISYERMKVLIENNKVNKVVAGYDFLRQNYKGLNIQLIEKAPDKFIEILDQLEVDTSDMEKIITSSQLNVETKFCFVNAVDEDVIIKSTYNSKFVLENVLKNSNKYSICESLQIQLINRIGLPVTDRINLFLQIHDGIDNDTIKTFLISLGNPYDEIANPKKSPKIKRNALNSVFMNILIQKGIITSYSEKTNQVYHSKRDIEQ